jgi:hypothetical protein
MAAATQAQIANTSFFPSMRSINPGVSHLRKDGFMAVNSSKTNIVRQQDIVSAGLEDGIKTEVELDKTTVFRAGKGPGMTIELLFDQESGTRTESMSFPTFDRSTTTSGSSSVMGGTLDLGFVGVSVSKATYEYLFDFNVGETPSLNRETHKTELEYTLTRVGTAFEISGYSIGAFYSQQTAEGSVKSHLYNPSDGVKAPVELSSLEYETISYGTGLGYVSAKYHFEASMEQIISQSVKQDNTYLIEIEEPSKGSRVTVIAEGKFGKLGLGVRVRQINGNFTDLEQLISSNMLYSNAEDSDSRLENSFNFSYGSGKGFSLSGFYSTSKSETEEENQLFDDKYPTTTTTTAYGLGVSYIY